MVTVTRCSLLADRQTFLTVGVVRQFLLLHAARHVSQAPWWQSVELVPALVGVLHDGVVHPAVVEGARRGDGGGSGPTRGVHRIVKVVRLTLTRLIVVAAGAVVDVRHLRLETVEPLPVVDGDGDGEAEDEDGDDDSHRCPRPALLPLGLQGGGGGGVLLPHGSRAVGT